MLIRREVFAEVGQFSEAYFMYAEDLDLCYKVASAGYSNVCVNTVSVIHYGGGSSTPSTATVRKWHSILQYLFRHRGPGYTLRFRFVMAVVAILRLGLLSVAGAYRGRRERNDGFTASNKWAAILRTLFTCSGRVPLGGRGTTDPAFDNGPEPTEPASGNAMHI